MPTLYKFGGYIVFFWSNENNEPIHVHISKGKPSENATKVWLTKGGGCLVEHNKGRIPQHDLTQILESISIQFFYICSEWKRVFNTEQIKFYC